MLASRLTEFTLDGSSHAFLSGANRQQAKMTFQYSCRKWLSHKDLEAAVSYSWFVNSKYRSRSQSQRSVVFWRNPASFGGVNSSNWPFCLWFL